MTIDLAEELAAALASPKVKEALRSLLLEILHDRDVLGNDNAEQLVGAEQAAKILGMSVAAVRKAAVRGTLPCHRLGRRLRFRVKELVSHTSTEG